MNVDGAGACRFIVHCSESVRSAGRTLWNPRFATTEIRRNFRPSRGVRSYFIVFQRPLLFCDVEHPKIIDTSIFGTLAIAVGKAACCRAAQESDAQSAHEKQD